MKERTNSGPLLSRRFRLVLLHLAEEARRDLDALAARPVRAIHALRTRMKNLRALLLLVRPRMTKPVRKAVAELAGALKDAFAEQRDAQVVSSLRAKFPGLGESSGNDDPAKHAERDKAAKADAGRLIRTVSKLGLHGLTWADVLGGYLRSYRTGRKAMKACEREPCAESFHEWRRPVKDLFYQSQALQPLDGMKQRRRTAERLGDRLGEMNDLEMLRRTAAKSRIKRAVRRIEKRQRELRPAIFKAAEKLFGGHPREIAKALERCVKFQPAVAAQAVRQA